MNDPAPQYLRSGELLSRGNSRLLIIDVQEKLLPLIPVAEKLIENCRRLLVGADILGVPAFGTEQYPQGLGPATPILSELLDHWPDKIRFSAAEVLDWGMAAEQSDDRDQIVVAGLEAHVCVQQTVLDLLAQGYRIFIPADAVASRHKFDWQAALGRLSDSGAIITTTESVLFEWCEVAGTSEFRQISQLIKGQ